MGRRAGQLTPPPPLVSQQQPPTALVRRTGGRSPLEKKLNKRPQDYGRVPLGRSSSSVTDTLGTGTSGPRGKHNDKQTTEFHRQPIEFVSHSNGAEVSMQNPPLGILPDKQLGRQVEKKDSISSENKLEKDSTYIPETEDEAKSHIDSIRQQLLSSKDRSAKNLENALEMSVPPPAQLAPVTAIDTSSL